MLRRPEFPLFVLVLGVYAYFYQAGGWNQNSRFDLTRSLVDAGTTQIDAYHANTGDESKRGDHYYCDKAPGVSLMAVPAYVAVRGLPHDTAAYVITLFAIGLPSAVAVVALFVLLGALGLRRGIQLGLTLAYAFGTLAFPYATLLYGHQVIAALLLVAFAILACARARERTPGWGALFAVGFLLGWSIVVEYPAALACIVIFAYGVVAVRPRRRLLWIVAGGVIPGLVLAAYHTVAFGGPTVLPYSFSTQPHRHLGFFMGLGAPDLTVLGRLFVSSYRGLFFSAPCLLLASPGAAWLIAARRTRAEGVVCAAIFVLCLWLDASLVDWDGGWAMGPRYLVPAIPFLAILAAGLPARRAVLVVAGVLVAVSIFLMLVGTVVKPEVPSAVKRPFQDYLLPSFFRGEVAINFQSIDMKNPAGASRFAWNLGEKARLHGLYSLLPLVVFVAGVGWWLVRTARRAEA